MKEEQKKNKELAQSIVKDFNANEFLLWRKYNNRTERRFRRIDCYYIDEPGISKEEIERRLSKNHSNMERDFKEQLKNFPELFKEDNK